MTPPLSITTTKLQANVWLRIVAPFAAGYFISYWYRTINAVIAPDLVRDFGLDAGDLGLLTGVYFLAFALAQVPLGVLLDRYGARRVEALLLLIAAAGAFMFGLSSGPIGLFLGRALIGLGVSACLMASFKAFTGWFSFERLPAMNGVVLAAGGLGALCATIPVEVALQITSWRGIFFALGVLTIAISAWIYFAYPERAETLSRGGLREQLRGVAMVFSSPEFWRIAPLSMLAAASFLALFTLWLGPWLRDVATLDRVETANHLLVAALAMAIGHLAFGQIAFRLSHYGVRTSSVAKAGMAAFMFIELLLALGFTRATLPLLAAFGFFGTAASLSYAVLSQSFPPSLAGRVNTALNLLVFVFAFALQWAMGEIVNLFAQGAGDHSFEGYSVAFGAALALQAAAFIWLALWRRKRD
ncbi:MAG: MFS transporter [Burkholderiales bacterium]